jgi:hypothetical protein
VRIACVCRTVGSVRIRTDLTVRPPTVAPRDDVS